MVIRPGSRLLFIGDSVTDCDRARPVGAGSRAALGEGYVAEVDAAFAAIKPDPALRVINMGTSGNTVRDLGRRWLTDVDALQPDWLSVMIGINDVWRQFDGVDPAAAVAPEEFLQAYDGLIARIRPRLKGIILMGPFYAQDQRADPMRRRMDEYGCIVRDLAAKHGAVFVDVQSALDAALETTGFEAITIDRVHPTPEGHVIIARAFLVAIGVTPRIRR